MTSIISTQQAELTKVGAVFHVPDKPAWIAIGRQLIEVSGCVNWWLGDWLTYGEEHEWGLNYSEVLILTDYDYGHLRNIQWVAKSIPLSRRCDTLSWSHHQEVAPLPALEQALWLGKAAMGSWSKLDLRRAIRAAHAETSNEVEATGFSPSRWVLEFIRWAKTLPDEMPQSQRDALKRELQPIVEMYARL